MMLEQPVISNELGSLLRDHVRSTEALELLLLVRSQPTRVWPLEALLDECGLSRKTAAEPLQQLAAGGLVEVDDASTRVSYRVGTPQREQAVDELVRLADGERALVLQAMSQNAIERVRRSLALVFADAFLLGGRGEGGKRG